MNSPNNDNNNLIPHQAFSVSLILINILAHVPLERQILKCALVSRWWNQLATERLWYRFRGLKNNSKTQSFEKFYLTLILARDGKCLHQYGKYVRILDLERLELLELDQELLLKTLECCQRIEIFTIGSAVLNKKKIDDMVSRLPNLKFLKFSDSVEVNNCEAMNAIADYCPRLEELELKRDILCSEETLLRIVQRCKNIRRLDIEEKNYEDQMMISILEQVPELTQLKIHQCISVSEEVLLKIFKFCPKLTKLDATNMHEITAEVALATARHFRKCKRIMINKVDRPLDSSIEASENNLNVYLYDVDLGMIVDYFTNRKEKLRELILSGIKLNKLTLGIICENLDLFRLELSGVEELAKEDVLAAISKLKHLKVFTIRFSTMLTETEYILDDEKNKLLETCPNLGFIQWHTLRINIQMTSQ